jgi:hypothetical protein
MSSKSPQKQVIVDYKAASYCPKAIVRGKCIRNKKFAIRRRNKTEGMFRHIRLRQGWKHLARLTNNEYKSLGTVSPSRQNSLNSSCEHRFVIIRLRHLP